MDLSMDGLSILSASGSSSSVQPVPPSSSFLGSTPPATTAVPPPPMGLPASTTPAAPTTPLFGVTIPGRPVRTDFVPVDASGLKFTLNLSCPGDLVPPLALIREVVLFLLPGVTLPDQHGVLCYYQLTAGASSTGFELLGAITPQVPSAVFQTGWSEKEEVVRVSQSNAVAMTVTIALSIESLDHLQNLGVAPSPQSGGPVESPGKGRLYVAQQIAYDLFNFMQSFDAGTGGPGNMVVPNNIFDRWFKRFENRFQRDPNFFLKNKPNE